MLLKKTRKLAVSFFLFLAGLGLTGKNSYIFAQEGAPAGGSSESQKIVYTEKQNSMRITAKDIKVIEEKNAEANEIVSEKILGALE